MVTKAVFKSVTRGLFADHRTTFALLVAARLDIQHKSLLPAQWELFLRGAPAEKEGTRPPADRSPVPDAGRPLLAALQEYPLYRAVAQSIEAQPDEWRRFAESDEPFKHNFDKMVRGRVGSFDRVLLTRVFRPEKLLGCLREYTATLLGKWAVQDVAGTLREAWEETDTRTPIIFLISQGADAAGQIKALGEERGFAVYERLWPVSLGQGQGERAEGLIERGAASGFWILLENCHLAKSWLPALAQRVAELQTRADLHPDFRLLLTCTPVDYFPLSVLQNSLKITTEPPRGLQANLTRSLESVRGESLDVGSLRPAFCKMTLAVCLFHAVVQERRKFGPLGWNTPYEFNDSDLAAAREILDNFLTGASGREDISWDALNFLIGQVTYGGRITDEHDARLLQTLLDRFLPPQVIEDRFKFCVAEEYKLPRVMSKEAMVGYATSLPVVDDPELFGLHRNASISQQTAEADKVMATIAGIAAGRDAFADPTSDKRLLELVRSLAEDGVTQPLLRSAGHRELLRPERNGLLPPLTVVLLQEISRFNALTERIRESLAALELAVQGKAIMTAELDRLQLSLLANRVPESWQALSYPSMKNLAGWLTELKQRIAFFAKWLETGQPAHFSLPSFFFPQGFLTAVLQAHARKANMPVDKFAFGFKVTDLDASARSPPEEGVYVSGLSLEAAAWDRRRRMVVDAPPGQTLVAMPLIHFIPKEIAAAPPKGSFYSCPLYKLSSRAGLLSTTGQSSNFVLDISLPCDKTAEFYCH